MHEHQGRSNQQRGQGAGMHYARSDLHPCGTSRHCRDAACGDAGGVAGAVRVVAFALVGVMLFACAHRVIATSVAIVSALFVAASSQ